jgi:hypothetical protein
VEINVFGNKAGVHLRGGVLQPGSSTPKNRNLKKIYFVDAMTCNVLRDLPFSRNDPLKLSDDYYIGILKNLIDLGSLEEQKKKPRSKTF